MVYALTTPYSHQNSGFLRYAFWRQEHPYGFADGLGRCVSEQLLSTNIPSCNRSVQGFADDGIISAANDFLDISKQCLTRQDFLKRTLNLIHLFADHSDGLLVSYGVCQRRNCSQGVSYPVVSVPNQVKTCGGLLPVRISVSG
jgi:hypothetical protein